MTVRLTNSEMKQVHRCRRKWYLGTYRGLRRRGSQDFNRPLSIGSRIHDVLAFFYEPGFNRDRGAAMTYFWHGVALDVDAHPTFDKDIEKEADLCDAILEGYFDWVEEEGVDSEYEVVAPEDEVEVPLIEGATLLSKIDVIVKHVEDGTLGNLEHKTGGDFRLAERAQIDTQFLTEHLVQFLRRIDQGEDAESNSVRFVVLNMLKKSKRTARAKPPFYKREEVHHNVDELRSHWRHAAEVARQVLAMRERLDGGYSHHDVCPPNPTRDCTWDCPFKDVCLSGMMDDGSDYEGFLSEHYEVGDPLERYVQGRE